jgi:AraC-like DNA-binding protein
MLSLCTSRCRGTYACDPHARHLLHEPGRPETLEEWSDIANAASCTLARLLASETGICLVDWRHQPRLADAF